MSHPICLKLAQPQAIGRPINYKEIPIAAARQQSEDAALMFEWFDRVGYDADIAASQGFSGGPLAQFCRLGARVRLERS